MHALPLPRTITQAKYRIEGRNFFLINLQNADLFISTGIFLVTNLLHRVSNANVRPVRMIVSRSAAELFKIDKFCACSKNGDLRVHVGYVCVDESAGAYWNELP